MFQRMTKIQFWIFQSILIFMSAIYLIPMVNVVILSFRGEGIGNYMALFSSGMPIGRMLINSLIVCFFQVLVIVVISSMTAFAFSKMNFPLKNMFYTLIMLTMSIPMISLMTPLFTIIKGLNMQNTYASLVLPAATMWMPVAILIQKNYYDSIGNELMEAARIDGCGWGRIFKDIYFPLGLPATINVIVFAFMNAWNDYLNPLLFSKTMDMYTFPMAVVAITTTIRGSRPEVVFACLVVMAIPSIVLYLALQKYLGKGTMDGAVKG